MAYDAAGNLVRYRLRHASGETTTQSYEVGAFNQVLSASTDGADAPTAWYEYDAAGKLLGARAGGRTAVVEYDAADRVRRVTLDGGERVFERSYEPEQEDAASERDLRTGEVLAPAGASAVFGPAHAIVHARLRTVDFGPLAYQPERRTFRVSADHLRPDAAFLSSLRRRMAPLDGDAPDPSPFGHDAPSNGLFLPPEYRAVNCQQCTSVIESVEVRMDSPVFMDHRTNITVLASGVCLDTSGGAENYPYVGPLRSFTFSVSFGDGTRRSYRPSLPSPVFSTSHVYRRLGPHRLTALVYCDCASGVFSFRTASVDFDVLCPVTPSTTVPSGVSGVTYNRHTLSSSPDGWGRFTGAAPVVDIAAYYDDDSDSWKPKVTSATSREEVYVGYPSHISEASVGAATKSNCAQMISDLSRTSEYDVPSHWAMLAAVRAHEEGHASEWRESLDMAFSEAKATIEGLSVSHKCKKTAAEAKTQLEALPAYSAAIKDTDAVALGHYQNLGSQYAMDAEWAVTRPVVQAIRAKAKAEGDWPSACQ